jgi:hypothetical protein
MSNSQSTSFSLTQIIAVIKEYFLAAIWANKWWIIFISVAFASVYIYQAWKTPKTYQAELSFMINEDESGSLNSVGALLGSLGLGGGSNAGPNYDKIAELGLSNRMLTEAFHEPYVEKDSITPELLGNVIIKQYNYHDKWVGFPDLRNFLFISDSTENYPKYEFKCKRAVKEIAKTFRGNRKGGKIGVLNITYNKESKILYIKANATSENLSIALCNTLYDVISTYYISKTIERQESTYKHMKHKSDSLFSELKSAEYQLARFSDQGNKIRLYTNALPLEQLARKVEMLYVMYGAAVENLETSEFLLKSSTPFFQKIDDPVEPLQVMGKSKLMGLLRGGMTGFILALLFFIGRYWLLNRLKEERNTHV